MEKAKALKESREAAKVYDYTPLAETSLGATELYNLYGVVIDAMTPCKKNKKLF